MTYSLNKQDIPLLETLIASTKTIKEELFDFSNALPEQYLRSYGGPAPAMYEANHYIATALSQMASAKLYHPDLFDPDSILANIADDERSRLYNIFLGYIHEDWVGSDTVTIRECFDLVKSNLETFKTDVRADQEADPNMINKTDDFLEKLEKAENALFECREAIHVAG